MAKTHELKSWPVFFDLSWSGQKRFEVRRDDRGYAVGDVLWLREWHPVGQVYTGRDLFARVSFVLGETQMPDGRGLEAGFVVLGLDQWSSRWEDVPLGG